mmetsp:Transcript_23560/g.72757  ORF Transcript_23560/g.72757 Transcript_23560/m.72757 type:complete len:391 (+) Transcript_23560:310-1482(+)
MSSSSCDSKKTNADDGSSVSAASALDRRTWNASGAIVNHRRSPCARPSTNGVRCCRRCSPEPAGPTTRRVVARVIASVAASMPRRSISSSKRVRPRSASRPAPAALARDVANRLVALAPKTVAHPRSCSQCSVWPPPRFRKSGFALRLKQFTKNRSKVISVCSHSCGAWPSSKLRFCFETAGVKYSSLTCASSGAINASALSAVRMSSSAATPPSTTSGRARSLAAFPDATSASNSASVTLLIALAFLGLAQVLFRGLTPTLALARTVGGPAGFATAPCFSIFASSSNNDRRTLSEADRSRSCTAVPIFLSTASLRSASASRNAPSYVSRPDSTMKLRLYVVLPRSTAAARDAQAAAIAQRRLRRRRRGAPMLKSLLGLLPRSMRLGCGS